MGKKARTATTVEVEIALPKVSRNMRTHSCRQPEEAARLDDMHRRSRAPHRADPFYRWPSAPLASGLSSDADHGYASHEVTMMAFTARNEPVVRPATLGPDGKPAMRDHFVTRLDKAYLESLPAEELMRDYLEPDQVALLLSIEEAAVYRMLWGKKLSGYQPSGEGGPWRVRWSGVRAHLDKCGYTPDEITALTAKAQDLMASATSAT